MPPPPEPPSASRDDAEAPPDVREPHADTVDSRASAAPVPGHDLDDDPSLRAHLRQQWSRLPPRRRRALVALSGLALLVWAVVALVGRRGEVPASVVREEARTRAEWAAILRQSPEPLGDSLVVGTLGPGDAQEADDRYTDFWVHTRTDSTAFAIVVTSADFAPDLTVRGPDGRTRAASNLLRTTTRAEVDGLVGPGRFEVAVTGRVPDAEGSYDLTVVPVAPVDSLFAGDPPRVDTLGHGPRRAGRYERTYGVVAGPESPVVVRVVSAAFVPRLSLLGPGGEVVEGWRSVERRSSGDSLHGVLLRYLPGWDAPYRLIVSSEQPGERGPYVIEVQPVTTRELRPDGRGLTSVLGDASWRVGPRYVDYYRFAARAGTRTTVSATSREIPPALRLWRTERGAPREVARAPNPGGAFAAQIEQVLDPGEYVLEVTTGGRDTLAALGGTYAVVLRGEPLAPPPPRPSTDDDGPRPASRTFGTGVSRTGQSGASTFEVGVTQVAVSYPAGRTRVQLSVSVRSVDYTGSWAPWASFVTKGYVLDDQGRRYAPSQAESVSPSGPTASPGTVRRGTVVFYAPGALSGQTRFVYVASLGAGSVTLPIPVP